MKHVMTLSVAGLLAASLPGLALAQTAPPPPPSQPPTTNQTPPPPKNPPAPTDQTPPSPPAPPSPTTRQTMPQKTRQDMPMRKQAPNKAAQEVATAHAHALMAQNAKSVDKTHMHLHHVINCLEGPQGQDFDADAENPCEGKGQGALVDSQANASMQSSLQQAVQEARSGLQADDLQQAQKHAANAAGMLQAKPAGDTMMHHQGQ